MDPLYSDRGTQFFTIPADGKVIGPTESMRSDGHRIDWCSGFISDADTTVTIVGKDGDSSASVNIAVLKGYPYRFGCRYIKVTGGAANIVGWI